ncbi:acyl oxidase [Fusarium sp. NRRL 52700]|nr:acyl oxidase [Fusarium sp. NRRL 52700]
MESRLTYNDSSSEEEVIVRRHPPRVIFVRHMRTNWLKYATGLLLILSISQLIYITRLGTGMVRIPNDPYDLRFGHLSHDSPEIWDDNHQSFLQSARPVPVHSHNDYTRHIPLFEALGSGCISIEADVHLRHGNLFVAHSRLSVNPHRTLQGLYLEPLQRMLEARNAGVKDDDWQGFFTMAPKQTVTLLVDLKTAGSETFDALNAQLQPLRDLGYLTYWNGTERIIRPLTVVGTGNTPFESVLAMNSTHRDIFWDAKLESLVSTDDDFSTNPPTYKFNRSNSYFASTRFKNAILYRSNFQRVLETPPSRELDMSLTQIEQAKARGLLARYWDTPSKPPNVRDIAWRVLIDNGIGILNMDDMGLFPSLPAEIRVSIWTWTLRYQRIFKIFLESHVNFSETPPDNGILPRQLKTGEDPPYYPIVNSRRPLNKLLRVNAESRKVALSFHRVHLPCWFQDAESVPRSRLTAGTIYINPEYDFLHVQQGTMAIVDFVCDLKTKYDPRNVGMRNLALCRNQLGGYEWGLDAMRPSEIEPSKMRIFKEIISGLDQVWLVCIRDCIRRMKAGISQWGTSNKTFFERSFPIDATPHSFDLIGPDPRTIESDLSHLHLREHLRDPKRLHDSWLRVLELIEVRPCEESLRDAENWLQWEDEAWTTVPGNMWPSPGGPHMETVAASETPEFGHQDLSKAVRPAFGFWLFPTEAFCDENKIEQARGPIVTFDVRKHRPELALLRLGEGDTDWNVSREGEAHRNIALGPPLQLWQSMI